MGNSRSKPLDADPRCTTLAPIWAPFVDAFIDTLHAKGAAHPPSPRPTNASADSDAPASAASSTAATAAERSPGSIFRPAVERLIAIGDLHGDLAKAREAFRAGGLIDAKARKGA